MPLTYSSKALIISTWFRFSLLLAFLSAKCIGRSVNVSLGVVSEVKTIAVHVRCFIVYCSTIMIQWFWLESEVSQFQVLFGLLSFFATWEPQLNDGQFHEIQFHISYGKSEKGPENCGKRVEECAVWVWPSLTPLIMFMHYYFR